MGFRAIVSLNYVIETIIKYSVLEIAQKYKL